MELIQVKKKKSVIQDTLVMDFVLCHTTFLFEWVGGGESYLTKEELWVSIWQQSVWKNEHFL